MSYRTPRSRHGRGIRQSLASPLLAVGLDRGDQTERVVRQLFEQLRKLHPKKFQGVSWDVLDIPEPEFMKTPVPEFRVDRESKRVILYKVPIRRATGKSIDPKWAVESRLYIALSRLLDCQPRDLLRRPPIEKS